MQPSEQEGQTVGDDCRSHFRVYCFESVLSNLLANQVKVFQLGANLENKENILDKFNLQNEIMKKQQKTIEKLQGELTEFSLGNKTKSDNQEFILADTKFAISKVDVPNIGALRKAGDTLRNNLTEGVAIVGSIIDNKPIIVIMTTVNIKIAAKDIASILSKEINGGGGGNAFTAQVGGKDPSKLDSTISNLQKILSEHYK